MYSSLEHQICPKEPVLILHCQNVMMRTLVGAEGAWYDLTVISPRNFFLYTPLLPGAISGTVEPRSIVQPVRSLLEGESYVARLWSKCMPLLCHIKRHSPCRADVTSVMSHQSHIRHDAWLHVQDRRHRLREAYIRVFPFTIAMIGVKRVFLYGVWLIHADMSMEF
jgi:hypothetical protein